MKIQEKIAIYQANKAQPSKVWLLFLFLGWSYGSLKKPFLQILFYLTLGGLGLWTLVRLFTLSSAIKRHNRKEARAAGMTDEEINLYAAL